MSTSRKRRNKKQSHEAQRLEEQAQADRKFQEEQELFAKLTTGYSSSYYEGRFGCLPRMIFQIPGNVAAKLADPVLLQYEWARSICASNKTFVVIHSNEQSSTVVDNHDGKLFLIVVDKDGSLVPGLIRKLNRLPEAINSINGSLSDYLNCRKIILQEMRRWQTLMEIPANVAKYWLHTPAKKLLSHDRKDSFNHLRDERNFWATLFRRRTVVVAKSENGGEIALAVKQENDRFFLQMRLG